MYINVLPLNSVEGTQFIQAEAFFEKETKIMPLMYFSMNIWVSIADDRLERTQTKGGARTENVLFFFKGGNWNMCICFH